MRCCTVLICLLRLVLSLLFKATNFHLLILGENARLDTDNEQFLAPDFARGNSTCICIVFW